MSGDYVGHLEEDDPLYHFLRHVVCPQIGVDDQIGTDTPRPIFRVFRLSASNEVYRYEEKHSGAQFIGKYFRTEPGDDAHKPAQRAEQEFHNIFTLRSLGFDKPPHYVIRALGCDSGLHSVLIQEFHQGTPLAVFLQAAQKPEGGEALRTKLSALADFLASLHNRTAIDLRVDFHPDLEYLDLLLKPVEKREAASEHDSCKLRALRDCWRDRPYMWEDAQVWVHGDATPANFLFGDGQEVAIIDLERMKRGDRVFDVGRLVAEIRHFFMQGEGNSVDGKGDAHVALPFVEHFLQEYSTHFPDSQSALDAIQKRVPYYEGLNYLRIARNAWIPPDYAKRLVHKALQAMEQIED